MVDGFEDLYIELFRLRRVEGHMENHESVSETLHTDTNRTVSEVRTAGFRDRIVIDINDPIQVECDGLGNRMKLLEVVCTIRNEGGEGERR